MATTRRSVRVSRRTNGWSWTAPRNSARAAKSRYETRVTSLPGIPRPPRPEPTNRNEEYDRDSIPSLHPAAGGDCLVDGRHSAGRSDGLSTVAGLGATSDRLSDDSGTDVLSRCQSRRHG